MYTVQVIGWRLIWVMAFVVWYLRHKKNGRRVRLLKICTLHSDIMFSFLSLHRQVQTMYSPKWNQYQFPILVYRCFFVVSLHKFHPERCYAYWIYISSNVIVGKMGLDVCRESGNSAVCNSLVYDVHTD